MIDRKIAPTINPINNLSVGRATKVMFTNGMPFYYVNLGNAELIKIEWMFAAGNWYQPSPLIAFSTNNAIGEGTLNYSSSEIIDAIEFYGASIGYSVDKDNAYVSLITMRKYLPNVLPLIEEIIKFPTFPEKELEIFKQKHIQQFLIEQTKVNSLARTNHSRLLFGENHPYGYMLTETDFNNISRSVLVDFHNEKYHSGNCTIIASGKIDENDINEISRYFGDKKWGASKNGKTVNFELPESKPEKLFIEKPDAVQNAIRIGKVLFNKTHADYAGMTVLNCILGGYFGSRLMKKIREEKGYTYGINSLHVSLVRSGFLAIVSEVGSEVTAAAIADIYAEIEILRTQLIPNEELARVKNYMMGEIVRMFDGPFAQAESLISLLEYEIDYEHYTDVIKIIQQITPNELLLLAQKHLDPASMTEVIVGKTF